jgi:hypothetical protein
MPKSQLSRASFICVSILVAIWLIWLFGSSEPFAYCVHHRKNEQAYQALQKQGFVVIKLFVRTKLGAVCAAHITNTYQGAITALATIVVAIFTGTLWVATAGMLKVTERQHRDLQRSIQAAEDSATAAKDSAMAALRSAEAMIAIERPWMVLKVDDVSFSEFIRDTADGAAPGRGDETHLQAVFVNEGKTTAFLKKIHQEVAIADYPRPKAGIPMDIDLEGEAVSPGGTTETTLGLKLNVTQQSATRILDGDAVIWIFGYLNYTDVFRGDRFTYFCLHHNMGVGCITPYNGDKENYMT